MSRRVKREDLDYEVIGEMTDPKTELLKEILKKKYFDEEYQTDLSIMQDLNLSKHCFYKYKRMALHLYKWNLQKYPNRALYRR